MLPTYRNASGSGGPSLFSRKSFRAREKFLIVLVFLTFCFVCFCGFFFLPDNFGTHRVLHVYKQFQKAGPEIFIPAPPIEHENHQNSNHHRRSGEDGSDVHLLDDRAKLAAKIKNELGDILEKPATMPRIQVDEGEERRRINGAGGDYELKRPVEDGDDKGMAIPAPNDFGQAENQQQQPYNDQQQSAAQQYPISNPRDADSSVNEKRDKVKEVSFH